jgi:hypothetical protein
VKWDCGVRIQRGILRNATPISGPYKVGDIVSYCRRARAGETGIQWSVGPRIVGFEVDQKNPEKDPATAWVICDGLSVCVATDKLRPCTAAELLAYKYVQDQVPQHPVSETQEQEAFVDEREKKQKQRSTRSRSPKTSRSATAAEQKEDEKKPKKKPKDSSESENSDLEKIFDEVGNASEHGATSKELREPERQSSSSSSVPVKRQGPEVQTQEAAQGPAVPEEDTSSLQSNWKRSKTTGKGVKMFEKTAFLFDDDMSKDNDRVGFLQVRLVGPKQRNRAPKIQRKKDGDKNLRYSETSPEIQKGLKKSRVVEWQKWKQFNAGVVLTREEVNELQAKGVKIHPMQWVETDKNAHKRRDGKYMEPLLKSRLVGCGNFEDTEDLRTDSPTGDVDSHNLVFSWCAANKVRIKMADISNAYLQGKEVDRILLYKIPRGGIPEEGIEEGAVIAARVPIYGTKDAGRDFWSKLKEVVLSKGYTLNNILPTMFTIRKEGRIVGVMSSDVDDLLYGNLPEDDEKMQEILEDFKVREQQEGEVRSTGKKSRRKIASPSP